jgi:hypothetical protein
MKEAVARGAAAAALLCGSILGGAPCGFGQETGGSFFDEWQRRASESQAEQPHWVTPVATVTPRLEQEIRYDVSFRTVPDGTTTDNIGNGKGLELIPARPIEIILNIPPYLIHHQTRIQDGFGDFSALIKYRLASAPEDKGNYIATVFLGASFPTGRVPNGAGHAIITPTLALGKGFRDLDLQTTFGVNIPTSESATAGHPLLWNATLQYHLAKRIWPEVEMNATFWPDGTLGGKKQIFVTPGIVFGRFPIHKRLGFTIGGGVQIAASSYHQYNHNWIVTARMPF